MNDKERFIYEQHPVKPYDPHYTRDLDNFNYVWDEYVTSMRDMIERAENRTQFSQIVDNFVTTVLKIHKFERETNTPLISYIDSKRRMRQNRSYIRDLL